MAQPSTADYRKYPAGPNFKLIVILAGIALVLLLVVTYFFVKNEGRRVVPIRHTQSSPIGPPMARPMCPQSFA